MSEMQLLLEAERRGILPPDKQALLDEARRRGLVPGQGAEGSAEQPEASGDGIAYRGAVLPLAREEDGGVSLAWPQFLEGPRQTVMDLLEGKRSAQDVTGKEVFELGGILGGPNVLAPAVRGAAPRAIGATEAVAQSAERLGVDMPLAAAVESPAVQQTGKVVANVPLGGAPLKKASEKAIGQLDDAAQAVQEGYGSGSVPKSGEAAREGLTGWIGKLSRERVEAQYDKVDEFVDDAATLPLASTKTTVDEILARRDEAAISDESKAVALVAEALSRPEGLNYNGTKTLRTYIGRLVDTGVLPVDLSRAELKQIYGALSDDLRAVVEFAGNERALAQFERANNYARLVAARRESLARVLGAKSDEGIYARIVAAAGSTSRADIKLLRQARRSVDAETWNEIASSVITNLGRSPAAGGAPERVTGPMLFSPDRFVTQWNKLTPQAKQILFRSTGKGDLARALDDIAVVSTRFKRLQQYANPSGTGQTVIGAGLGAGLVSDPLTTLATVAGAYGLSKFLAQPATARAVAGWSKAYERAVRVPTNRTLEQFNRHSVRLAVVVGKDANIQVSRLARELQGTLPSAAENDEE